MKNIQREKKETLI